MHGKKRSDERLTLLSKGRMDINGTHYNCLVDNISTIGALIEVTASEQKYFSVGETGTLNMVLLSPVEFLCTVVRINLNKVGLQFVVN